MFDIPRQRALKQLKRQSASNEQSVTSKGLETLQKLGTWTLKEARKALSFALREAPRIVSTGEVSFTEVAERVQHLRHYSLSLASGCLRYSTRAAPSCKFKIEMFHFW